MLTAQQQSAVKSDIAADPLLQGQPLNSDGSFAIAAAYNKIIAPTFFVWRSSAPVQDIMVNGFDWTQVDNLTVGKARIWEWMKDTGALNFSEPNVRAGVLAAFTGAGNLAMRTQIFGHGQRAATRLEKLLATGAGSTSSDQGVGPALMGFEGNVTYQDIDGARNS